MNEAVNIVFGDGFGDAFGPFHVDVFQAEVPITTSKRMHKDERAS